jgi:hypothetical protein
MHARLLHGRILLEPAYFDRTNAARRALIAVTANIAIRPRSGDLILMNTGLAKPIPRYLVYSMAAPLIMGQILLAAQDFTCSPKPRDDPPRGFEYCIAP